MAGTNRSHSPKRMHTNGGEVQYVGLLQVVNTQLEGSVNMYSGRQCKNVFWKAVYKCIRTRKWKGNLQFITSLVFVGGAVSCQWHCRALEA